MFKPPTVSFNVPEEDAQVLAHFIDALKAGYSLAWKMYVIEVRGGKVTLQFTGRPEKVDA